MRSHIVRTVALCAFGFAAPGISASAAWADMIDTSGMAPWELCAECHNMDGISHMAKFPKLAGQRYAYLVKQIGDFQVERRTNDGGKMVSNAGLLSDEDVIAVAKYFSSLPPPPPVTSDLDAELIGLGRRLFTKGKPEAGVAACASCHAGAGVAGVLAPRIEAQHADYLKKELIDFRGGARSNDPDERMRKIAHALSDAEIVAVAAYASTLERPQGAAP